MILILVAALAVGVLSFVTGRLMASRPADRDSTGWLAGAPKSIRTAEQEFEQNVQDLTQTVTADKSELATLLADPCSTDTEIVDQLDRVLESNAALMTAVGTHVVELRSRLSVQQRDLLLKSCVESLGTRVQRRYRWRGGAGDDATWQGGGRGFGPGPGRRGRQYRGGRTSSDELADKLQLTAAQSALANERDPEFSSESAGLRDEVADAYAGFVAGLENLGADDAEVLNQLDRLIQAHNRLEHRVARHVLAIRPQLSPQQRQRLAGASRGRYRYRGGRAIFMDRRSQRTSRSRIAVSTM